MLPVMPKLVLFDLDGTLVDSVPDLAFSLDSTLQSLGMAPRGEVAVRRWVGNGIERLVKRGLTNDMEAEPEGELFARAMAIFRATYADNTSQRSQVYPGVLEGLQWLQSRGIRRACVTNKAKQFTEPVLMQLGLSDYLEYVVSGDSLPKRKPDPMPLLHVAEVLGVEACYCAMVGDSMHDIQAAKAAGFMSIAVPYGYNHGIDIAESDPDLLVRSIADLERVLLSASVG